MDEIKAAALRIAEEANTCCHRSDGYEEDIAALAEKEIRALLSNKYPEIKCPDGFHEPIHGVYVSGDDPSKTSAD